MNIYQLHGDTMAFCSFLEADGRGEEAIQILAARRRWVPFPPPHVPVELELNRSDDGKRNYRFDVSTMTGGFIVFSQALADAMADILQPRGQFFPVQTPSKMKAYVGYYPTNVLPGCLDLERSDYKQYERGKLVRRYALRGKKITDDWLFVIDDGSAVFVTEKFRERVEGSGFKGFSWKWEVQVS